MSKSDHNGQLFVNAFDSKPLSVERIGHGRNSRVFKLTFFDGCYVAKIYHYNETDSRDRLSVEFNSLKFLWQNGVRSIPRPIRANKNQAFAIYEYIDGRKIDHEDLNSVDIDAAVEFLINIDKIKTCSDAFTLPRASEACFSIEELLNNLCHRYKRLTKLRVKDELGSNLNAFLKNELSPFLNRVKYWSCEKLLQTNQNPKSSLTVTQRTLSPSDFGFHNTLRLGDHSLVFLDFEYFGWDDPAKMIIDFVLHPGMKMPVELKRRFVDRILTHFRKSTMLSHRLKALYPLYGIKWCLILLNEFVPAYMERREFANVSDESREKRCLHQLYKARNMLREVKNSYEQNPFF